MLLMASCPALFPLFTETAKPNFDNAPLLGVVGKGRYVHFFMGVAHSDYTTMAERAVVSKPSGREGE